MVRLRLRILPVLATSIFVVACSNGSGGSSDPAAGQSPGQSQCGLPAAGAATPNLNLQGCRLAGKNLAGANLSGSDLSGADLTGTNLEGADLSRTQIINATLEGTVLTRAKLAGATVAADLGPGLDRVNLQRADLRTAKFYSPRFVNSNLRDALADAATFADATWTMSICPDGYLVRRPPDSCVDHF